MVIAVIRDPAAGSSGPIEYRKENEDLFRNEIKPYRAMGKSTVITNGCAQSAKGRRNNCPEEHLPARDRKKHYSNHSQYVD